ncbi:MAG: hypothetical protein C5B54_11200 [Acidobacteria bacterium]|nr:MAG: hypothetical protein C5B54_11200 [Acidobacteriota bacterium]
MQNNGGATSTHALLPGSPAIDAGDNNGCTSTDQRGANRPQDGNGDGIATCDMGAFEASPVSLCTGSEIFCDDFSSRDFNTSIGPWTQKGTWSAATADAVGSTTKKADLISPVFSCTNCIFEAHIAVQSGGRASLFAWHSDATHNVELRLEADKQKLLIKQKSGAASHKAAVPFTITPGTLYNVAITFNGTNFQVTVDGTALPALTLSPVGTPAGGAIFRVKSPNGSTIIGTLADIIVH